MITKSPIDLFMEISDSVSIGYLDDQLTQLKLQEIQVGKEIQEKYGEGAINISKGEFTSSN